MEKTVTVEELKELLTDDFELDSDDIIYISKESGKKPVAVLMPHSKFIELTNAIGGYSNGSPSNNCD